MDPLKLKDVAATLNAFMVKEGFLSEHSVKTIWDRLMSCITQGKDDDIGLAFPIRLELQNMISKTLPKQLDAFKKHVQDLDDEMNKVLPSPNMSLTIEEEGVTTTTKGQAKVMSSCQCGYNKDTTTQGADALKLRDELDDKESRIQQLQEKVKDLEAKIVANETIKIIDNKDEKKRDFNGIVQEKKQESNDADQEKKQESSDTDQERQQESNDTVQEKKQVSSDRDQEKKQESNDTDHDKAIEALQKQIKEKDGELKIFKSDVEHLQHRLSTFSSIALRDSNENMIGLSDADNPVRLAEKYAKLYDNEWADSFEALTKELGFNDTTAIKQLVEILYDAYDFCDKLARRHLREIGQKAKHPCASKEPQKEDQDLDAMSYKAVCDLQRLTGKYSFTHVQTLFLKEIDEMKSEVYTDDLLSNVNPYLLQCVELCWYMVLQTPSLYINTKFKAISGEQFNADLFKFYTETGDTLDYIVWPPLYRQEGGAILSKGVAQPKGVLC